MSVDAFLGDHGIVPLTGSSSKAQRKQFAERLLNFPLIASIAEIGFHVGYSAECFFENCKTLEMFVSFDVAYFPYVKAAALHFKKLHPEKFFFVEGNSLYMVPLFAKKYPQYKFDLIFIDGCHVFEGVVNDILNAKQVSHPDTILWLDDYHMTDVLQAIQFCEAIGIIQVVELIAVPDTEHLWAEAKFLF